MDNRRVALCIALQRYTNFPPVTLKQRELACLLANEHGLAIELISAKAPIALAPTAETVEQKTEAFAASIAEKGIDVHITVLEGKPSDVITRHLRELPADWVVCGAHSKHSPFNLEMGMGNTAKSLMRSLEGTLLLVRGTREDQKKTEDMKIPGYPVVFMYA